MTDTKNYRKTQLTLPDTVVQAFAGLDTETRNAYVHALRDAQWTLQSISEAAGITRERVRQIVTREATGDASALPLPEPPEHAPARAPARPGATAHAVHVGPAGMNRLRAPRWHREGARRPGADLRRGRRGGRPRPAPGRGQQALQQPPGARRRTRCALLQVQHTWLMAQCAYRMKLSQL